MQEKWVPSLGQEYPLEAELATHTNILAWEVPKDKGAWQATVHGVTRVGHDLATEHTHNVDHAKVEKPSSRTEDSQKERDKIRLLFYNFYSKQREVSEQGALETAHVRKNNLLQSCR